MATPELSASPTSDPRWELAQRVADSSVLRNCTKLRGFLLYVCEQTLLGQPENIREQLIGSRVFGRPADYNIAEDNIVRVEARELRKRLQGYFDGEGRAEPTVIEIPKGAYVPVFLERPADPEPMPAASRSQVSGVDLARQPVNLVLLLVSVMLLAITIWQFTVRPTAPAPAAVSGDLAMYRDLLGPLSQPATREILVVLSNPRVVLYYGRPTGTPGIDGHGLTIPAPPELRKSFGDALNNIDRDAPFQFLHATREDYTGMGEAVAGFHLGRLLQQLQRPVRLIQGRFLSWDRVHNQNLALLGSPLINDWTYRNIGNANFKIVGGTFLNQSPLPGEPSSYSVRLESSAEPGTAITDYGVITMATSSYGYNVFSMFGTTSAGTAGVGEFFANPAKMKPVYDQIAAAAPGKPFPSSWEILVKIDIRDGLPVDSVAVAQRPANPSLLPRSTK